MFASWILAACIALVPVPDIIHLKGGQTMEGRILREDDKGVILMTAAGEVRVESGRIERIERKPWVLDEFKDMWAKVDKSDATALKNLLDWCLDETRARKLRTQAKRVARRLVRLEPDNAKARKAMGQVKFKGKWVSRREARRMAKADKKAAAEARLQAEAEAKRQADEKERLAMMGGVTIAKQVMENRKLDGEEARYLSEQCALDYKVYSSRRISIKGIMDEEKALRFLALGEKMCGTLNKELGLPVASSPFRKGKHNRIHFFLVDMGGFAPTLKYINGRYTTYDAKFLNYALKRRGGVTADGDGCVGIQISGQEHDEDVFCHYFGHAYVESIANRVGHWFTEGFAVYCSVRFHGNAVHLCTTQSRYTQNVDESDRKGASIKVAFLELAKKKMLPPVRGLLKRHMNTLREKELAKCWGTVAFFMSPKIRPKFLKYLQRMPYAGGDHKKVMQEVYGWEPEKLDELIRQFKPD